MFIVLPCIDVYTSIHANHHTTNLSKWKLLKTCNCINRISTCLIRIISYARLNLSTKITVI